MDKIELINEAIENAMQHKSKLTEENFNVPGLVSLWGRHLYNNIGSMSTRLLEIGSHLGCSFTSAMSNNNLLSATAIDNFASDLVEERQCMPLFLENVEKHLPATTAFNFIHSDAFEADMDKIPNGIDMYTYDGTHDVISQRKAVFFYLDKMADEFVFIVDDADWEDVQVGTRLGLAEAKVEVIKEWYLPSKGSHDNLSFWNGYFIFLLKKK